VQKKYKTFQPYRDGFVIALLLTVLALAGCGSSSSGGDQEQVDRFDAKAAYTLVERQVGYGQRPAGSPRLRRVATELRPLLPDGHFEPIPGEPRLRNVVGTLPGREPGIVVGAHYDTLVEPRGFVGANNGAAGTAVVIEASQALRRAPSDPEARQVDFVLFDGEEPPAGLPEESPDFYSEGLRGSRAYVAAHRGETSSMILLDYVGNKGLRLPREATSTEALWNRLLIAAEAVDAQRFFSSETGPAIIDDHAPFLRSGVPAVDLIDWSYPGHSLADSLDKISRRSLDAVGETVVQLVEELRKE
jgi:glutaminyl-peptide cyclotransferase